MPTENLPTKLENEPLIDVVCGIQFKTEQSANTLLPGLLLSNLQSEQLKFETLPTANLPQILRDKNPAFQNIPLTRVTIGSRFNALLSEKWLGVGCQMPYAGWTAFKDVIIKVFGVLRYAPFITDIERYTIKYVDLLASDQTSPTLSRFNIEINVGGHILSNENTQIRTEIRDGKFFHIITIASSATANRADFPPKIGSLVDVDTQAIRSMSSVDFLSELPDLLDEIHIANKRFFFSLLSQSGLAELGPRYD